MNRILILDDEINICTSLEFLLEEKYEVVSFQKPDEAIDFVKREDADIMLLDLRIGKVNGIDVLKEIKRVSPDLTVIMMTA